MRLNEFIQKYFFPSAETVSHSQLNKILQFSMRSYDFILNILLHELLIAK